MFKDSLYLSISKGLRSISSLIIVMILARFFIEEEYGLFRQIILIATLFGSILPLGIPTSISYLYRNLNEKEKPLLINTTLVLLMIIGLIFIFILNLPFIKHIMDSNYEIVNYLNIVGVYIFVLTLFSFLENLFVSNNKGHHYAIVNIIMYTMYIIGFLLYTIHFDITVLSILIYLVGFEVVKSLILIFMYYKNQVVTCSVDVNLLKRQFTIAIPAGLAFIVQTVNLQIGNLYVMKNYSLKEFAIYSVATSEIPFISIVTISIATAILPTLSFEFNKNKSKRNMIKYWGDSIILTSVFIFPVFWILIYFASSYIEFIFSEKYLNTLPFFCVFLLKLPLAVTIFGNILIVINKSKLIIYNMLFAIVLNIFLLGIFSPKFGILGVVIAMVLTQLLLVIINIFQIKTFLEEKLINLFPLQKMFIIATISFSIATVIFFISNYIEVRNILKIFIFGIPIMILSCLIYIKLGYFNFKKSR